MDSINRTIYEIVSASDSNKVTIFTNSLKIDGYIYQCEGRCKEVADNMITLNDVIVCKLDDYCSCEEDECTCNDFVCFKYHWFNVMHDQIVAFSILH